MCCSRLAANTGCKSRHLGTIAQLWRATSSQLRHVSTIGKNLLSSNTSSTCLVNFSPLVAEILSLVWGTPGNFNGFRVLATLLQRRRSTEVNQTLHYVWPSPVLVHYIHFRDLLPPDGILPRAKFTFCPSTHHRTTFSGYSLSSQLRHLSTIGVSVCE